MTTLFSPIGFNWQICIALIPGLAAREVAVSSLATVYALSAADDAAAAQALSPIIAHGWSMATGLSLLVWYIYAPQCLSHARDDQARDRFVEAGGHQRRLSLRPGVHRLAGDLPGRRRAGSRVMHASLTLQYVVIGIAVAASAGYVLQSRWPAGRAPHAHRVRDSRWCANRGRRGCGPVGKWIAPRVTSGGAGCDDGCDGCSSH
jgi:hypothetical protein